MIEMLNVQKNLVRDQAWKMQINLFQLNCTFRTMKRACSQRERKIDRFCMIIIKLINLKNKQLRVKYNRRHVIKTMNSFWQYIHFTNEIHFDLNEIFSKKMLREKDTRYENANMQFMFQMKKMKLHFKISISWYHKISLFFYFEEHDSLFVIIKKSFKSRKSRYQTKKTYQQRILEWKISLSHNFEIKFKKNSMTQIYYIERLLFVYVNLINENRVFRDKYCFLQKNNDNNHETRLKNNIVVRFKIINWINTLSHFS